ncbi:hypothetical protein GQ457_03G015000 [Hibiscus cannabinus]
MGRFRILAELNQPPGIVAAAIPVTVPARKDRQTKALASLNISIGPVFREKTPNIPKWPRTVRIHRRRPPLPTTAARHRFCKLPPLTRSSRPSLPRCMLSFSRHSMELDENGFERMDSSSPDLLHPLLDGGDSEIYGPPRLDLHSDRWDSPSEAPIAGDAKADDIYFAWVVV